MLLVAAALSDEIRVAMGLCTRTSRIEVPGAHVWTATRNGRTLMLLRTGIGLRCEARLRRLLERCRPSKILVVGFAGALDPALKLGELVVARRASILSIPESGAWMEECTLSDSFELASVEELESVAGSAGISCATLDCLTAPHTIGDPVQKAALRRRFGAGLVDMETAALARAASAGGIPVACVRAITDEADDRLFSPFSRGASSRTAFRLGAAAGRAHLLLHWEQWQKRVRCAQGSLARFLREYLDAVPADDC
jgi:nucleoside phosphorylase